MQPQFADVWEIVAAKLPDAPALVHGDRRIDWGEFNRRADGLARFLLDAGLSGQEKVAQFLHNGPEYLESAFAFFKTGLVSVNANFLDDDLVHVLNNSDTVAVVFHARLLGKLESIRAHVPGVRTWLCVEDGSGSCSTWATSYEEAVATEPGSPNVRGPCGRSPDDLFLLYTGGTTGPPKAVVWRQEDLFVTSHKNMRLRLPVDGTPEDVAAVFQKPGPRHLPVCPLIHGYGSLSCFQTFSSGGSVVTLTSDRFDPIELLDTIARERVASIVLAGGDAQGKPILEALDAAPSAWDLSSLTTIMSSGAMFSEPIKRGLVQHGERLMVMDALGSSETSGMAWSVTGSRLRAETASFRLNEDGAVITEDGRFVQPGSGERGFLSKRGNTSIGYYKDEAKTAAAFREIDGERWLTVGDMVTVEADASIRLLGRRSNCISSSGETIFAEEVEEAVRQHPTVRDVAVVGVPDGGQEIVVAVVEPEPGSTASADELIAFVHTKIEPHKAPRKVLLVPALDRLFTGKNNYNRWRSYAVETLA
jgi:acyl-CoA synthetase (AMP-forming)/AMP-acid ligase II